MTRKIKVSRFTLKPPVLHLCDGCDTDPKVHERNLKALQNEEKKLNPNKAVIMGLMKKTFYIRRWNILKTPTTVSNILKIYPSLRNCDQVSCVHICNIINIVVSIFLSRKYVYSVLLLMCIVLDLRMKYNVKQALETTTCILKK